MANRRQSAGVTLIELMVAVAIVGILAAIAYPSYQRYVARTHRNAATACMSQYTQFMERYYTTNLTYVGAAPSLPCRLENDLNQRYTIGVRAGSVTARAFTLDAVPTAMQDALDLDCDTLWLDQSGRRDVTGTAGANVCWR